MRDMRLWEENTGGSFSLQLAADTRLCATDFLDDQVWEITPGSSDAPALTLKTRYGGRVGLASLVPMWLMDGGSTVIYETSSYATAPRITHTAPGYARLTGAITDTLSLTAEYLVFESKAIGGRFTLANTGTTRVTLHMDLFGYAVTQRKPHPLAILTLNDGTFALSMGRYASGFEPVVAMDNATATIDRSERVSPKIGVDVTVDAGTTITIRWVHAGMTTMDASLERAQHWLKQDWDAHVEAIRKALPPLPEIVTGDPDLDHALDLSAQQLVNAFFAAGGSLARATVVASRDRDHGYSRKGDGSDYDRGWSGTTPQHAYLAAASSVTIQPDYAKAILQQFLAAQKDDGRIDFKPGPAGQRSQMMATPLLARIAWRIYEATGDEGFVKAVLPGLLKFFRRWTRPDLDSNSDGLPEWQDERQTGYVNWPTFITGESWAQGADLRYVETPGMAAHMLSEALHLRKLSEVTGDRIAVASLNERIGILLGLLDGLFHEGRYTYIDRDTRRISTAKTLLEDGRGDEPHPLAYKLDPPARVIVRVIGGTDKVPAAVLTLEGIDADGKPFNEIVETNKFRWGYGSGVYTTRKAFSQIDKLHFTGLSRVYRIEVTTVDTTRLDINALLPLMVEGLPAERVDAMVRLLTEEVHFWRPNGVTVVSAQDPAYDPSSANGGGGIWPYFVAVLAEGLVDAGHVELATQLIKRMAQAQAAALRHEGRFAEFYHSDEPRGLGEARYLSGIVPLYAVQRVIGARVLSPVKVWAGGPFHWGEPVSLYQHGVSIRRSADATDITFPSGHTATLPPDAPWQEVIDPNVTIVDTSDAGVDDVSESLAEPPTPDSDNRVIIETDEDTGPDEG